MHLSALQASFVGELTKEVVDRISGSGSLGGPKSVGIITFYNGQKDRISVELGKRRVPLKDLSDKHHQQNGGNAGQLYFSLKIQ